MQLSHKIRLEPTVKQLKYFAKAAGTARFVYNLALAEWTKQYSEGKKPNAMSLKKEFNQTKYDKFPWLKDIHRDAHSQPFTNLQSAFNNFFKKQGKYPKFKKKGICDSFYLSNDKFKVKENRVKIPKLGWVKMAELFRFQGKIMSGSVSKKAGQWYISINVDLGDYQKQRISDNKVGIDLGLKAFATLSNGDQVKAPKPLKVYLKKLKRLSRELSRKKKGSSNFKKAVIKLSRLHSKISNIRTDFLHKLSTKLCQENQLIAIEDLAVKNLIKNRKLSRHISDAGWAEFRRQLEYKSLIYGNEIVVIDRFAPSSKACCECGNIKQTLTLRDRTYKCECGNVIDRDLNAAKNILTLGQRGIACGQSYKPASAAGLDEAGININSCSLMNTHWKAGWNNESRFIRVHDNHK